MAHINYNFLTESFLFNDTGIEDGFKDYSDKQIKSELDKYRNYILSNMESIRNEIIMDKRKIKVTIESFDNRPSEEYLKQLVLYIDCVLIADPLFELTENKSDASEVISEYMGMKKHKSIDRKALSEALKYMKNSTPFIVCDFVKFIPTSLIHEAPKDIPIVYDENGFRESLPEHLMSLIKQKLDVRNIIRGDKGLIVTANEPLKNGTMLYLFFSEIENRSGEIVLYQKTKPDGDIGADGHFDVVFYSPKSITDYEFAVWLEQSRNRASLQLFEDTVKEYSFASGFNSMYLTGSELKAQILSSLYGGSPRADIANLAMRLNLPVIEQADLITILDIREKYGESFKNFRVNLGNELVKLRGIDDNNMLKKRLDEISYQIYETSINTIDKDIRKIINSIKIDGGIITGSLLTSCIANCDGSVASAAVSLTGICSGLFVLAKGVSGSLKEIVNVKDKPEYFLWKLDKKVWKMK